MSFCPHCHSGVDPVLKDTTWSCGVRFNDALWRTKECYKRQIYVGDEHLRLQEQHISELEEENGRLKQRIKRLEEAGDELEDDKQALLGLMYQMGAKPERLGSVGVGSTNRWRKAKEDKP